MPWDGVDQGGNDGNGDRHQNGARDREIDQRAAEGMRKCGDIAGDVANQKLIAAPSGKCTSGAGESHHAVESAEGAGAHGACHQHKRDRLQEKLNSDAERHDAGIPGDRRG
jgi:hypothetical protein